MNEFYKFRAEAGDEPTSAELMIFAAIGDWEEMGDVSARGFAKALGALPKSVKRLDIHINSPGGSVFEASAIYSRLADHPSTKVVFVDGLAASAASIVAMVGHKIYIRSNANMMIHLPSGLAMGNSEDMRHMATALDSITESMINVYAKRTKLERDEIRDLMSAETWFSPALAVEKGFADEERGVVKAAAVIAENRVVINGVEHDLSRFHNVPAFTASTQTKDKPMNKKKVTAAAGGATADPDDEKEKENGNGNGDDNGEGEKEKETPTPTPATDPTIPKKPNASASEPTNDFDRGVQAERARVMALQKLDRPATHAIVAAAITDGRQVTDIAGEICDALDNASKRAARHADASVMDHIPPSDGADENQFGGKLKNAIKARMKNRRGLRASSRN